MKRKLLYVSKSILALRSFATMLLFISAISVGWGTNYIHYGVSGTNTGWENATLVNTNGTESVNITLTAGKTYEFLLTNSTDNNGTWWKFSGSSAYEVTSGTEYSLSTSNGQNGKISNATGGTYIFTVKWNNGTPTLTVTFPASSSIYTPVLEKADEISCFFEAPSSMTNVYAWIWGSGDYNYSADKASADWNSDAATLEYKGLTESGKKIWKWTYNGSKTDSPTGIIFLKSRTNSDNDKINTTGLTFTNHGYYVYDGTNISSDVKVIETKYSVNISAGEGGTVYPEGEQQVGSTPVSITATPNDGFSFVNWTATGNGITIADATNASTTITATSDGSVTAVFTSSVTPTTTYYLVGDNFGGWSTDKGKPFVNDEVTVNFDNTYSASQFKILSSDGKWYGIDNFTFKSTNTSNSLKENTGNAHIDINLTGTYTFKMTENSDGTITLNVTYPESSKDLPTKLKFQSGAVNNWASNDMTSSDDKKTWEYTLDMSNNNAGEVWFRFVDADNKNSCILAESNGVLIPVDGTAHEVAYLKPYSTTNNFKFYTTGAKEYTIVAQQAESGENWSVKITEGSEKKTEYVLDCNGASYSPMQSDNVYTFTMPKSAFTSTDLSFSIAKKGTSTTYLSASNNTFSGHVNTPINDITESNTEFKFTYTATSGTDLPSGDITVTYNETNKTLTLNYESQQSVISGSYYVVFPDANVGNTARADKTVTDIPDKHTAFRLIPSRNRNDDTLDEDLVSINLKIDGDKGRQLRYDTNGEIKFYITDGSGNYFKTAALTSENDYLHAIETTKANNGVDCYDTRSGSVSSDKPGYYYTIKQSDAAKTKSLTFMFSKNNKNDKKYIFNSGESAQQLSPAQPSNSVDGFGDGIKSGNLIVGFLTSRGHGSDYYTDHISNGVYLVGQMDGTSYTHNKKYEMKKILYPLGTTDEAKADSIVYSCTVKKGSADWDKFFLSFSTGDKVEDGNNLWNLLLRPNVQNQMDGQALEGGVTFFKNDNGTDNAQQALNPLLSAAQKERYVSYTIYFNATYSTYRIEFHDGFYIAGPAVDESRSYAPENRIAMSSAELNGKQHYIYTGEFKQGQEFAFFLNEDSYTYNYCEDGNPVSEPLESATAWDVQAPTEGGDYAFYNHVQYNTNGSNENKNLGTGKNGMVWGLPTGTYTIRFYNHAEKENGQLYTVDKEVLMANATSSYKNNVTDATETEHNNGGWRTFSDDCALLLPNGVTAYYAAKVQNGKVYFKEVPNGYIPAHCPVIISNPNLLAGNKSIAFPVRPEGYDVKLSDGETNYLVDCYDKSGTVSPEVTNEEGKTKYNYFFAHKYKFYGSKVMSGVPLGFWKTFNNAATKKNYTYLSVDEQLKPSKYEDYNFTCNENEPLESTKAYCFRMVFDEDELGDNTTTGIEQVKENAEMDMTNAVWHNMQGVRIRKPSAPGMYICNGKKVVVR